MDAVDVFFGYGNFKYKYRAWCSDAIRLSLKRKWISCMKNSFKKIIGISLLAFGLVTYGASSSESEIQQRFDNVPGSYKMIMFDRLLNERNVLLLGPERINKFLDSLPEGKEQQKKLLLCQLALHEMPIALAVKCISCLTFREDYSERLLREGLRKGDLNSLEWWGHFIGERYVPSKGETETRWNGYELLNYCSIETKINLIEMILEKYWDCFSLPSAEDFSLFSETFSYKDFIGLLFVFKDFLKPHFKCKYIKRYLETKNFEMANSSLGNTLLYKFLENLLGLINYSLRNALIADVFEKKFDSFPLPLSIFLFLKITNKSDRIKYGQQLLSKNYGKEKLIDFDKNIFVKDRFYEQIFLAQFIEEYFNLLDTATLLRLVSMVGFQKIFYLNQLIASKKIENLSEKQINLLFTEVSSFDYFLPDESTTSMAILLLDSFFETSSASVIVSLLDKIAEKSARKSALCNSLFGTVREKYFHRLVASGKLKNESDLKKIFKKLLVNEKEHVVTIFKESLDTLTSKQALLILYDVSDEEKKAWLRKNNVFWKACYSDDPKATGPLFSKDFISKNNEITENLLRVSSLTDEKIKHVKLMMSDFKEFMEEHYRQDRIVFLHGQQDQWAFLAGIFDDLITIKYGHSIPEDFVRLRFKEGLVIESDDEVRATRENGYIREAFKDVWFHVLFTNLHLLANDEGSNTLFYFLKNYDQTTNQNRFDFKAGIKAMFFELDMIPEYDALMKEMPTLFTDLYGAYKKDVVARGDIGRLIAISMPKGVAQRLAYSSGIGGPHRSIDIDGEPTVDVVKIAEKFGQARYDNEHVVIMSKEMTNPYEALKAGIKMRPFTADSNEKSLPLAYEFEEKRTAFKSWVISLYCQRKETARRFREICPYAFGHNPLTVAAVGRTVAQQVPTATDYTLVD